MPLLPKITDTATSSSKNNLSHYFLGGNNSQSIFQSVILYLRMNNVNVDRKKIKDKYTE